MMMKMMMRSAVMARLAFSPRQRSHKWTGWLQVWRLSRLDRMIPILSQSQMPIHRKNLRRILLLRQKMNKPEREAGEEPRSLYGRAASTAASLTAK